MRGGLCGSLTIVGGIASFAAPTVKLRMNWFEVFKESKLARLCTAGPNTRGGRMVDRVKFGDSFSINSQAALSANVLLAEPDSQKFRVGKVKLCDGWLTRVT